jgi:hypothetical protein
VADGVETGALGLGGGRGYAQETERRGQSGDWRSRALFWLGKTPIRRFIPLKPAGWSGGGAPVGCLAPFGRMAFLYGGPGCMNSRKIFAVGFALSQDWTSGQ